MDKVRVLCVALAGIAALSGAVPASADPITFTTGAITVGGFARGAFRSIGVSVMGADGTSISATLPDGPSQPPPPCSEFGPCTPGATTNPSNTYSFNGAFGAATLDGTSHSVLFRGPSSFTFTGEDVVLPPTTADAFDLRSPFLFQGLASIWTIDSTTPVFFGDFSLTGHGIATTHLQRFGSGYAVSGFSYEFANDTASPTPEPASLLLLGTGLAAAWQSRRLRRTW